jgi:hypothetical protein
MRRNSDSLRNHRNCVRKNADYLAASAFLRTQLRASLFQKSPLQSRATLAIYRPFTEIRSWIVDRRLAEPKGDVVTPRRLDEDECNEQSDRIFPIIAAETLRNATSHHHQPKAKPAEEKISLFWRIFGGTILSIVALVIITACQSVYSSIHDLQKDIAHLNESKGELVRNDEYSATRTKTWEQLQTTEKEVAALSTPINQLKDRVGQLEEQCKMLAADRKDSQELNATLKERLMQYEQQLVAIKTSQKDVQTVQQTISAMQEKMTLRDQQFIQLEEERKELLKEIQALRERLARVEAKEPTPQSKSQSADGKATPGDENPSAAKH